MGRKKSERPTNANVAARILAQAKVERLWLELIELEKERLALNVAPIPDTAIAGPFSRWHANVSIIPLVNLLRYLEDRAYGRPVDTVNHLHDKPIEVNATLTLGEGMRLAMQKADERVRSRK